MKRSLFAFVLCSVLAGCGTQLKVAPIDPKTGLLQSDIGTVTKAEVITAKQISLKPFKNLAYVSSGGDYGVEQVKTLGYFDRVVNNDDLQKLVIANNLQDKVTSLNEPIGLNKLYRSYKPFLWIAFKRTTKEGKPYLQLIATNPDNLEEIFVSQVHLDFVWAGVNDQNSRYPLFNSLIEWLKKNP